MLASATRHHPRLDAARRDPVGPDRRARHAPPRSTRTAKRHPGLRVLHRASGFTGALVALDGDEIVLRGHTGLEKRYSNLPGTFAVDGTPTHLVPVRASRGRRRAARRRQGVRTASGSRAVVGAKARVARGSRIWVEGVHDAELVEKVWGDDLRVEGIVVERLDGADHLEDEVRAFGPGPRPAARRAARPPRAPAARRPDWPRRCAIRTCS